MMQAEFTKKIIIQIDSQESQENLKNSRKTLKVLQHAASDKENLVGRPRIEKDTKLIDAEKHEAKRKKMLHKSVQTSEITESDLTSDQPSEDYWRKLAEKRGEALNDSFKENERLKEQVDVLQEENKLCKEMLDESRTLVEVLQEMINDTSTDAGDEETSTME